MRSSRSGVSAARPSLPVLTACWAFAHNSVVAETLTSVTYVWDHPYVPVASSRKWWDRFRQLLYVIAWFAGLFSLASFAWGIQSITQVIELIKP